MLFYLIYFYIPRKYVIDKMPSQYKHPATYEDKLESFWTIRK